MKELRSFQVNLHLDAEQCAQLDAMAKASGLSRSAIAKSILKAVLDDEKKIEALKNTQS